MEVNEKSIQELENDFWPDLEVYPTGLVERCHHYRKVKIKDLQIHQITTLLRQDIGSDYLMPLVLERMDHDITEEDDHDGTSFIDSLDSFSAEIFKRNPNLHQATLELLQRKQAEAEGFVGWKRYERIVRKVEEKMN